MRRWGILLAVLTISIVGLAQVATGTSPQGPVTIETAITFADPPFRGTFEVKDGSEILGCMKGTFVDFPDGAAIRKVFTCDAGAGTSDTFTALFEPLPAPGPGDANGHWNILESESTGHFVGLHGEGEFSVIFHDTDPPTGTETLTGTIHFDP